MTNAEKFKEVFGFELNTLYEIQDDDSDYDEMTFCNQLQCENCPFIHTKACVYNQSHTWWQSEYKEKEVSDETCD